MPHRVMGCLLGAVLLLGAAVLPAIADEAVPPAQRAAIEQIVHDYLLQHPEVLIQSLQDAQEKERQQDAARAKDALAQHRAELVDDPTAPVGGNPKGNVTIVEFFDYRCPYCKQVEPALEALLREDGQIRIVYKEFPILGKPSVLAAQVALAARQQGKYAAFHSAMMAAKGQIDDASVWRVAANVGLDIAKAKAAIGSGEAEAIIKRNYALAEALDIRGTPAFVIGGEMVPGAIDIATLKEKIAAARKG